MSLIVWDLCSFINVVKGDDILNKSTGSIYTVGKRGKPLGWVNWNLITRSDLPKIVSRAKPSHKDGAVLKSKIISEDCSLGKFVSDDDIVSCGMRAALTTSNIKRMCALLERKILISFYNEFQDVAEGKTLSEVIDNFVEVGWGGLCIRVSSLMNQVFRRLDVGIEPLYSQKNADVKYKWAPPPIDEGEIKFKIDDRGAVTGFQGSTHGGNKAPYTLIYFGLRNDFFLNLKQAIIDESNGVYPVYNENSSLVDSLFIAVGIDKDMLSISGQPSDTNSRTMIRVPSENIEAFKKKVIVGKVKKNKKWIKMEGSPVAGLTKPAVR